MALVLFRYIGLFPAPFVGGRQRFDTCSLNISFFFIRCITFVLCMVLCCGFPFQEKVSLQGQRGRGGKSSV